MRSDRKGRQRAELDLAFAAAHAVAPRTSYEIKRQVFDELISTLWAFHGDCVPVQIAEKLETFICEHTGWGRHFVQVYLGVRLVAQGRGTSRSSEKGKEKDHATRIADR